MATEPISRRSLIGGLMVGPALPWLLTGCLADTDPTAAVHPALAPPLDHLALVQLDLSTTDPRATLRELVVQIQELETDQLLCTLAIGASAFTALGVEHLRPHQLAKMPSFAGDLLLDARSHGDLLLQVEAGNAGASTAAAERIVARLPGAEVRSTAAGARPENRMAGGRALLRNPFGFTEGVGNPSPSARPGPADVALVGAGSGEPGWAVGGSYLALRVVRLAHELWAADPIPMQDQIIGRRRDGTWLDGTAATHEPPFERDPEGQVTPLDAHVRRARAGGSTPPLLRRSWAWTDGPDGPRNGLLFMCFQRDLSAGFEAVQRRLQGQALDQYMLTVGGGYYLAPPPIREGRSWVRTLTEAEPI